MSTTDAPPLPATATTGAAAPVALRAAGFLATAAAALPVVLAAPGAGVRGVAAVAAYAVFAALFAVASSERTSDAVRRALLLVQAATACAAAWILPQAAAPVLLVVVAAQAPGVLRAWSAWTLLVVGTALMTLPVGSTTFAARLTFAFVYLAFEAFAFYSSEVAERERRGRRELAAALLELQTTRTLLAERARVAERERLTADLHDVLGHDLVALRVSLEAARRLPPESATEHLARAGELAGRLLDDVRALVREPARAGGADVVAQLAPLLAGVPGLRVTLEAPDALRLDDADAAEALVRCAQEAVTNAVRHARATRVALRLLRDGAHVVLEARDDGRGPAGADEGAGLRGMRQRAERLGGSLVAGAADGGGFRVRMAIPVAETRA